MIHNNNNHKGENNNHNGDNNNYNGDDDKHSNSNNNNITIIAVPTTKLSSKDIAIRMFRFKGVSR